MTGEVEARLRASLRARSTDGLVLLSLDDGLMAWLRAFVSGWGLYGGLEESAVFMIRSHICKALESDVVFARVVPHLPSPIREANMESPKWKKIAATG